jgi:hypothetical protein
MRNLKSGGMWGWETVMANEREVTKRVVPEDRGGRIQRLSNDDQSGPGARPMEANWVREIRNQCVRQGVAFFFKQWGGLRPKTGGRALDDREWNEFPPRNTSQLAAAE